MGGIFLCPNFPQPAIAPSHESACISRALPDDPRTTSPTTASSASLTFPSINQSSEWLRQNYVPPYVQLAHNKCLQPLAFLFVGELPRPHRPEWPYHRPRPSTRYLRQWRRSLQHGPSLPCNECPCHKSPSPSERSRPWCEWAPLEYPFPELESLAQCLSSLNRSYVPSTHSTTLKQELQRIMHFKAGIHPHLLPQVALSLVESSFEYARSNS